MRAAAIRGADELDGIRAGYEDRLAALRVELEQQEVDKAALLDVVQVPMWPYLLHFVCTPFLSVCLLASMHMNWSNWVALYAAMCVGLCICLGVSAQRKHDQCS